MNNTMNNWSCLPAAFSIALGVDVCSFIEAIGHDGSQILWPGLKEPSCRRGFHIQECIDVAYRAGYCVTPFEVLPRHAPAFTVPPVTIQYGGSETTAFERFNQLIEAGVGVITGHSNTTEHAVAYRYGIVVDPKGFRYVYSPKACEQHGFIGYCAWQFDKRGNCE
jgi:hypothetical protein